MAISLRVVVTVLVTVVGVAATLISLLPVRDAGMTAVRDTAALLRVEIADRLAGDLLSYFKSPMSAVSSLRDQHKAGLLNVTGDLMGNLPSVALTSERLGLPCYMANPQDEVLYVSGDFMLKGGMGQAIWNQSTENYTTWYGTVNLTTYNYTQDTCLDGDCVSSFRPTARPWYASVAQNQSWGPVYVEKDETTVTTVSPGGPMWNPITNALEAVAVLDVRSDFLLDYFSTVTIAKTGRAMLLHTDSRACLGGNWNESAIIPINNSYELSRLATVYDLKEPLFARTVAELGEAGLFNVSLPFRTTFGSGSDKVYVDLVQIADQFGLDMRLLVMIPEKDFLSEINSKVNTTIGATAGAVAGLLIIAFLITAAVLSPLTQLEDRMYRAATFQTDDSEEDAGPSVISEVANIQEAFDTLTKELKRVKSYLPQSLLAQLEQREDSDYDEDDEGEIHHGGGHSDAAMSSAAGMSHAGASTARGRASKRASRVDSESVIAASQSRATSRSRGSIASASAYSRQRGLNTADTILTKKVTVVCVNVLGSHRRMKRDWRDMKHEQTMLLEKLPSLAKKFKAVVDSFQGDHFIVTFNAVLNLASHQSKAGHFALALKKEFESGFGTNPDADQEDGDKMPDAETPESSEPSSPVTQGENKPFVLHDTVEKSHPLTIGIATSDCLVGNMGVEGFKRFNIVGPAFTNAQILERLCKQFKKPILTNSSSAGTMSFDTKLDAVGLFTMVAGAGSSAKPTVLYTVVEVKDQQNDEWMYDLKEQEERDLGVLLNTSWVSFADNDLDSAKIHTKTLMEKCAADEKCLSAGQRGSLLALADAVTPDGATLDRYLEKGAQSYYIASILGKEKVRTSNPLGA